MDRENRLVVVIAAALVIAAAIPFVMWRVQETRRPILVEARIVMATAADPVFREGPRRVGPDEQVEIAVAVLLERAGSGSEWLAPVPELVLDGERVAHQQGDRWPEDDRWLRVNWFTLECAVLGGELSRDNAAERLRYRSFLAPEMGRALRAEVAPEAHNDDFLGSETEAEPLTGGTLRLHARVEIVARPTAARIEQAAATLGVDRVWDPAFAAIHRRTVPAEGVRPEVGELFLLPGYEAREDDPHTLDEILDAALGRDVAALVEARLMCTSRSLAALALTGSPTLPEDRLVDLGEVELRPPRAQRRGRTLRWGQEARAGDLLRHGGHWLVLLGDNGDGILDSNDHVLHCWRRPAAALTLGVATGEAPLTLEHLRLAPPEDRGR